MHLFSRYPGISKKNTEDGYTEVMKILAKLDPSLSRQGVVTPAFVLLLGLLFLNYGRKKYQAYIENRASTKIARNLVRHVPNKLLEFERRFVKELKRDPRALYEGKLFDLISHSVIQTPAMYLGSKYVLDYFCYRSWADSQIEKRLIPTDPRTQRPLQVRELFVLFKLKRQMKEAAAQIISRNYRKYKLKKSHDRLGSS